MKEDKIDRLLRAAAKVDEAAEPVMPFGFDTRVVALTLAGMSKPNGLTSLLRRVALLSAAVIVISAAAAAREARQSRDRYNELTNEFAIADRAIQDELSQ
jgi:acid phosphatase family membrane protein YuiD